jgi:hypothetical protein
LNSTLGELAAIFDRDYYALVVAEQKNYDRGQETIRSVVAGVVTRIDLLNFISKVCVCLCCVFTFPHCLSPLSRSL